MGRRKIEIKAIKDDRNRSVTFLKRKGGLFKKAHELSVLCSVDVAVIIFGHNKKLYEFSSGDIREILQRSQYYGPPHELKGPADFIGKCNSGDPSASQNGPLNAAGQPDHEGEDDDDEDASGEDALDDHASLAQQQSQQHQEPGQPPIRGQTKSKRGNRAASQNKRQSSVTSAAQHQQQPNMMPMQRMQPPPQHLQQQPHPHMQHHPGLAPQMAPQGYHPQMLSNIHRQPHPHPYAPSVSPPMNPVNAGMMYGPPHHGLPAPAAPPGSRHGSLTTATGTPQSQPQGPPSRPISRNMAMSIGPSSTAGTPDLSHQHQQLGMATPPTTTAAGPSFYQPQQPQQQPQHLMHAPPPPPPPHHPMGLPSHMQPSGYIHPHQQHQHAAYLSAADANRRSSVPLPPGYTHSPQGTPIPMSVPMAVPSGGLESRNHSQNPSIVVGNVDPPSPDMQTRLHGNNSTQQQHNLLKSKSIFTPIDDRGSVLAHHLGLVSRSPPPMADGHVPGQEQEHGQSQSQVKQETQTQELERSRTEISHKEDSQNHSAPPPNRTQSLPIPVGSDSAPPIPPPVSRSSIGGHANAKRPRLTVQIPGETGSVEPDQSLKKMDDKNGESEKNEGDAHLADRRNSRQEIDASSRNMTVSPRSNANGNNANRRISRSTSRTPLPLSHDKDVHAGNGSHTAGGSIKEGPDGHVVLPPPSPSAGTGPLLSAGAQGPPNPFARPHPPSTTAGAPTTTGTGEQTPLSAFPSRFVNDSLLPSPSNLYPDWPSGFGSGATPTTSTGIHSRPTPASIGMSMSHVPMSLSSAAGGSMSALLSDILPSPLNFTTPVVPTGPGFGRDSRDLPRESRGLGLTFGQTKPERKEKEESEKENEGENNAEGSGDKDDKENESHGKHHSSSIHEGKRKNRDDDNSVTDENDRDEESKKQKMN